MQQSFLWGAATSSHQVEGNTVKSDWWQWEQSRSDIENSGRAADQYHLWRDDFKLAKELGHTAHRFSLEWSRIEPKRGEWDMEVLDHYREMLVELRSLGIASFVTLHHFTNPQWFAERGGWERSDAPDLFGLYAKKVAEHLGELVDFWVTINEPMVYATQSYWAGRWPPQKKSIVGLWSVIQSMAKGHRKAYRMIHSFFPEARVGVAKHVIAFMSVAPQSLIESMPAYFSDWWFNHRFMQLTHGTHDYIGVNYYFSKRQRLRAWPPGLETEEWTGAVSDLEWPIDPEGFGYALRKMKRYGLPIYVTENGLADAKDLHRADFIRSYLRALEAAQADGVDIRGYLHWSLLDNFEWDLGYGPRFGLVEVDYKTMRRTPRPSAYVYRAIIEQASRADRRS